LPLSIDEVTPTKSPLGVDVVWEFNSDGDVDSSLAGKDFGGYVQGCAISLILAASK
jgi:hypothetical protein